MSTESDHDNNLSPWEEPFDRRSALVKAGGVGAALVLDLVLENRVAP